MRQQCKSLLHNIVACDTFLASIVHVSTRTTQELKKFYSCDVMRCDTHPNHALSAMMQNKQIIVKPPLSISHVNYVNDKPHGFVD